MTKKINPIRATTPDAIELARQLTRNAKFGALAVLDLEGGGPYVSRVATIADIDHSPIILVSELSYHTKCLVNDPRCSILLGEPGKGDPLAHPRVTLTCSASRIGKGSEDDRRLAERFLDAHAKAKLYISFADFCFYRLRVRSASLNGGFGQAFILGSAEFGAQA